MFLNRGLTKLGPSDPSQQLMTDIALTDYAAEKAGSMRRATHGEPLFRGLTFLAALFVLVLFIGVMIALTMGSLPAIREFGPAFLWTETWKPATEKFGAFSAIVGTLVTSFLAMLVALPVGIGVAIFLTELCPRWLRRPIGIAIELLAGIPSIIFGIWGLFVFAPWFQLHLQEHIIEAVANVPVLGTLLGGPAYGIGTLTAGLILSIMTLPFIAAVTRDVFLTVPSMLKEAAYGLGCTNWEVVWQVVIPYARTGVFGGAMLALGRALGETMAVTFVIGNAHRLQPSLFAPGTSISATIANEFTEATTELYTSSLITMGLVLFFITFIVLATAQLMLRRLERQAGK